MINNSIRLKHFQRCIFTHFNYFVEIDVWAQYAESKFVFIFFGIIFCPFRFRGKWKKALRGRFRVWA